jgi:pyridoxal phosphate enzyme (YggS family)
LSAAVGKTSLAERLAGVRQRIEAAARRSGRAVSSVRLVAVSKFRTVEEIEEAIAAGVTEIGESRVQEAETKRGRIAAPHLVWHLVGRLQSNKAKKAVQYFDIIHSIGTLDMARRVDRLAGEQHKTQDVLIQVQVADEESKQGLAVSELYQNLERMAELTQLRVLGLMALPPYLPNPEDVRPYFARLRELRDGARSRGLGGPAFSELSMGMSHDFEVAVEEGATFVRVGTAIFGERPATGV